MTAPARASGLPMLSDDALEGLARMATRRLRATITSLNRIRREQIKRARNPKRLRMPNE